MSMLLDIRFAFRTLRKNLGVTILAVTSLALAIAGNTAVYSLINSFINRPLPYAEVERLVLIGEHANDLDRGGDEPEQLTAGAVTPGFFQLLGSQPAWGREFSTEEGVRGRDHVVVVSHSFWQDYFGGSEHSSGETLVSCRWSRPRCSVSRRCSASSPSWPAPCQHGARPASTPCAPCAASKV